MFEASMYTFVFLWTPALSPRGEKIPHGLVFSCFMTACMAGSALTGLILRRIRIERFMVVVYVLSALAMAVPFLFHLERRAEGTGEKEERQVACKSFDFPPVEAPLLLLYPKAPLLAKRAKGVSHWRASCSFWPSACSRGVLAFSGHR